MIKRSNIAPIAALTTSETMAEPRWIPSCGKIRRGDHPTVEAADWILEPKGFDEHAQAARRTAADDGKCNSMGAQLCHGGDGVRGEHAAACSTPA